MSKNPIEVAMRKGNGNSGKPELTVDRVASILGVTRQTVNNYLKDSNAIPLNSLLKLSSATGISLDVLCGQDEKPMGPKIRPAYSKYAEKINQFIEEARKGVEELEKFRSTTSSTTNDPEALTTIENSREQLLNVIETTRQLGRKPTICAFGSSDTGKSTLMNYLIGETIVPAQYSPMTTVPMYVMHESEKPIFLQERDAADNAIVIGRKRGTSDERVSYFNGDLDNIRVEDIVRVGNYRSILEDFGTRVGAYYEKSEYEVDEIFIFVDVDILREFTFIDIPGFGSGDEKDDIGLTLDAARFDVIFFLSTANAYMRGNELTTLCNILRERENLSSTYILATHAYVVGDPNTLEENVIKNGCERIVRAMSDAEKERLGIKGQNEVAEIKNRCFGFDVASEKYCENINKCLEKELPEIVEARFAKAIEYAKEYSNEGMSQYGELYEGKGKKERRQPKSPEEEKQKNEEAKKRAEKRLNDICGRLKESIQKHCEDSLDKMKEDYAAIMDKDFIVSVIEKKHFNNKKTDIEDLGTYLSGELNDRLKENLSNRSKVFSDEVNKELEGYKSEVISDVSKLDIDMDFEDFNFQAAFAAGLTGLATYGALAVWAAVVAAGSNLGAYILVAKVVAALSALGISVGGTAAAAAFVASIGGPVTIGISIAILAAITMFGIFTGTWKSRVANRIIKAYEEQKTIEKCNDFIKDYWEKDTNKALEECIKSLCKKTEERYDGALKKTLLDNEAYIKVLYVEKLIYFMCIKIYYGMCTKLSEDLLDMPDALLPKTITV